MADICRGVLDETNLCRTNPQAYALKLERLLGYFTGLTIHKPGERVGLTTNEGPSAVREAIQVLSNTAPLGPLQWRAGLARAAQDHCADLGVSGVFGHSGKDGSAPADRMSRYGEWQRTCGENIMYGCNSAEDIVMHLLIDDGVPSRGHRNNILNQEFGTAGVGYGPHKQMRQICTIDYAGDYVEASRGEVKTTKSASKTAVPLRTTAPSASKTTPSSRPSPQPVSKTVASSKPLAPSALRPSAPPAPKASAPQVGRPREPVVVATQSRPAPHLEESKTPPPNMPPGAIKMDTRVSTMTKGGRTVKKTTITYTFQDGSTQTTEATTTS
jgi:uncharacterized protein YkwD